MTGNLTFDPDGTGPSRATAKRIDLLAAVLAFAAAGAMVTPWSADAGSSYLAVWSSDKEKQTTGGNTDFLAIIDADPRSSTYGKVVNTAYAAAGAGRESAQRSRPDRSRWA